jgi:hypothetical protein
LTRTFAEKRQADFENLQNQPRTKSKPRNKANQNHRRPKRKPKTLKPISATRQKQPETLLTKENLLNEKAKLENLLIENQTQTQFKKNAAATKLNLFFPNSTTKRNLRIKDGFAFALGLPNGLRYLRWGGDGEAVQLEK